ncbi:hypothetical protein niasHS_003443 [Heterodera schachtii]|uniref:Uncharacterized protein n=1 Tax=Heterodera schachtii TaxID=97005 RepID=A0ABD2KGZ2_HETSC
MNYFSFLILLNIIFLNFGLSSATEESANEENACFRVGFGLFGRISWPNDGTKGAEKKDKWAKWLSVETKATTVSDCVRQCYEYRFCHSVLFEFKTHGASSKKGQCQMFLHASENCRGEQLTPIYRIEPTLGKPSKVFVECLKCAAFAKEDGTPTTVIFEQLEKPQKIAGKRKITPNLEIPMVENEEAKERTRKTTGEGRTNAAGAERQLRRRTRQMWRACVVTFEVLPADASEKALQQFRATKTASVSSLNECAFICFQNACLNAFFEQSEESERTAKCHLDMETENEICTPGQQRDYSYPNKNGSVISCVRCVATLPSTLVPRTEGTTTTTESATTETAIEEEKNATEIGIESETATSMLFSQPMELAGDVRDETEGNGTEKVIETTGEAKIETITQKGKTAEEEEEKKEHKETEEEPEFSMDEENQTEKEKETTEESTTVTDRVPTLPILIMNEHQGSEGRPKSVGIAVPSETNPTATTATTEGSEEGEEEEEAQKTRENGTTKAADQPISERKVMLKSEEKVQQQEDDANASTASSSTEETAVTAKVELQEDDANATTASSSTEETPVTVKVEQQEDDANATTASSSTEETPVTAKVELQEDDANATTASSSTEETAVTAKVEQQEDDANATTASSSTEETAATVKVEQQENDANATTASSSTEETPVTAKVELQEDDANATTASSSTEETAVTAKVELLENDANATTASSSTGETAVTPKVELQEDDANATTASSSTEETAVTAKVELLENDANATTSSSSSSSTVPFELPAEGGFESDASSAANNRMNNSQLTDETMAVPFPTEFQNVSSSSPETETTKMTTEEAAADDVVDAVSKFVDIVKMNNSDVANATEPTVKAVASIAQFVVGQNASSTLGFGINECSEDLLFSGQVLKDYTQSFEVILAAETVYDCVHSCYQQNCSRAAFTHFPRSVCLMHFGDEVPLDQKCAEGDRLGTTWDFSSVPEVVEIKCVKCAGRKESVEKSTDNEQNIAKRHFSNDENAVGQQETTARHILNPQGLTLKCDGRVEFVASPVANLHPLNITNDVPADTAADCARKCFEAIHCTLAAFIPTPGHESAGGICLLTSDAGDVACAGTSARHSPQHASTVPFLIKCIRCSRCHYALTLLDTQRSAALMPAEDHFEQTVPVRTVGECAEKCAGQGTNCSRAQFDPNKSMCSFSTSKNALRGYSAECPAESGVQSDGIFPLLLDCVKCFGNNSNSEAQQSK